MAKKSNSRLTARAHEMYVLIERYLSSDLQQRDFCEQSGIPLSTLHYWLYRYRADKGLRSRDRQPRHASGGFLALRPATEAISHSRYVCEVILPKGIILRLTECPDGRWLSDIAAALRDDR